MDVGGNLNNVTYKMLKKLYFYGLQVDLMRQFNLKLPSQLYN